MRRLLEGPARLPLAYLLFALALLWPAPFANTLIGHPDIDVWNHIWGYWFFAESFSNGVLPWHTTMIGAPHGGVLYFIDPIGATVGGVLSSILGLGLAFNLVQLARITAAGLVTHLLSRSVTGRGPHNFIAGAAFASSPYLIGEIGNGITEVLAVWWIPLTLLAFHIATRDGGWRRWLLLGAAVGGTTVATFYYGTAVALTLPVLWIAGGFMKGRSLRRDLLPGAVAAGLALAIALPMLLSLKASIASPQAMITRSTEQNAQLIAHNAVDLREYFLPWFRTVDFEAEYGEMFDHTGYLRLSALALAIFALVRSRESRRGATPWMLMGAWSLILGLGPYLWWGDDFLRVGSGVVMLPYGLIQEAVPFFSITHPLRFSVVGQVVVALLAAWALVGVSRRWIGVAFIVVVAEGLIVSRWPIPMAPAAVPSIYEEIAASSDPRGVLDLPAEVNQTMSSSRYFWYQTHHGHPIPYVPDARAGSSREELAFNWINLPQGPVGQRSEFSIRRLSERGAAEYREHFESRYGWVILHRELAEQIAPPEQFLVEMNRVFGTPEEREEGWVWRLDPPTVPRR